MQLEFLDYINPRLRQPLQKLLPETIGELREVRLRVGRPLALQVGAAQMFLTPQGGITRDPERGIVVEAEDLSRTWAAITESSVYALEEEIRRGFITLRGGHRVGIAGTTRLRRGEVEGFIQLGGLSFRVARELPGCANHLVSWVVGKRGPLSTLIIGAPASGKTTILRDLARSLASGAIGVNVTLIDERSELAACYGGVPQLDVGVCTDVIDGCPKAYGMMMAIRALNPKVIITDEIGRAEDVAAIRECLNAGVAVIASAHASRLEEIMKRPGLNDLIRDGCFQRGILLSSSPRPGTVMDRYDFENLLEGGAICAASMGFAPDHRLHGWLGHPAGVKPGEKGQGT